MLDWIGRRVHKLLYKHIQMDKDGWGSLVLCYHRFWDFGCNVAIYPEGIPEWQDPYLIKKIQTKELEKVLAAKNAAGLILTYLSIKKEQEGT